MKNNIFLIIIVIVISTSIFIFSRTLFHADLSEFAKEFTAAILGALITVFITAILLKSQTVNNIQHDKNIGVFHTKLEMYTQFCEFLNKMISNDKMSDIEQNELQFWAMKLTLLSGREVSDCLDKFFMQAHHYRVFLYESLDNEQKKEFRPKNKKNTNTQPSQLPEFITIGELLSHLKHDLGETEVSNIRDVNSTHHAMDDIIKASRS
jgi:hypothetical protein